MSKQNRRTSRRLNDGGSSRKSLSVWSRKFNRQTRVAAGAFGFFTLFHIFDGPDLQSSRSLTRDLVAATMAKPLQVHQ
jgi:hypothetical protein